MTRAVVEAITYGLRDSLELVRQSGIRINEVRVAGGGAKSDLAAMAGRYLRRGDDLD